MKYNPPPNWPPPPPGWEPGPGWSPDPAWPPPPEGWQLWVEDPQPAAKTANKRARLIAGLLVLAAALAGLGTGLYYWLGDGPSASAEDQIRATVQAVQDATNARDAAKFNAQFCAADAQNLTDQDMQDLFGSDSDTVTYKTLSVTVTDPDHATADIETTQSSTPDAAPEEFTGAFVREGGTWKSCDSEG